MIKAPLAEPLVKESLVIDQTIEQCMPVLIYFENYGILEAPSGYPAFSKT